MSAIPADLLTVAEASGYRRTSYHREVLEFLARLASRTPHMRVASMGASGLGQDLAYVVVSRRGIFTPEAARASGLPVVLIVGNIHAGEVEGKEACCMLARDATLGARAALTDGCVLLLLPDYNPDGNDRIDKANRALDLDKLEGQVGPEEGVGTRYTGAGWNLNRDYTKHDAVESRCLSGLLATWRPHVVVDCHTTDGSIHGYELTYDTARNLASCPPGPAAFARDVLLPEVTRGLFARTGFRTWFYGNFRDNLAPEQGWESYPPLARYGSHFRGLLGGVDILLEAYSYVDFRTRCDVTYGILVEIVERAVARGPEIVAMVAKAAADTVARGAAPAPGDVVGIDYGVPTRDAEGRLRFRHPGAPLFDHDVEAWDLDSQRARRIPGLARRTYRSTFHGRYEPTVSVQRPWGYVVPAACASALEKVRSHRLVHHAVAAPVTAVVEAYRVVGREPTASPDVGDLPRTETVFTVRAERVTTVIQPGDVIVPTAQAWGNLAIYLLEPHSDDGLARWGHFDDVAPGQWFPVTRLLADPGPLPRARA